jgi:hypothetical protein
MHEAIYHPRTVIPDGAQCAPSSRKGAPRNDVEIAAP